MNLIPYVFLLIGSLVQHTLSNYNHYYQLDYEFFVESLVYAIHSSLPVTKAIHQTMLEQNSPTSKKLLWMLTHKWSQHLEVLIILVPWIYISSILMVEYMIISLHSFINFPKEKKFTLVAHQSTSVIEQILYK
jgi:hypothetical protein